MFNEIFRKHPKLNFSRSKKQAGLWLAHEKNLGEEITFALMLIKVKLFRERNHELLLSKILSTASFAGLPVHRAV